MIELDGMLAEYWCRTVEFSVHFPAWTADTVTDLG